MAKVRTQVVEARVGKVCQVCGELKQRNQFYKEKWNVIDNKDGFSDDCRSCRLKAKRKEFEDWKLKRGIR